MGRDKALLEYHGRPQLAWAVDLLALHCERVFVSVRPGQSRQSAPGSHSEIVDAHEGIGPIAGIAASGASNVNAVVAAASAATEPPSAKSSLVPKASGWANSYFS
jgi:molybdopterin-guanine dinucleotide biosynthesis protein A